MEATLFVAGTKLNNLLYAFSVYFRTTMHARYFISKPDKFRGVYILDGKEYYAYGTYATCKEFFDLMQGKVITAKHVKSENLLIELRVGDRLYTDNSVGMRILTSILLGLVLFAFLRSPIHWILNRFV